MSLITVFVSFRTPEYSLRPSVPVNVDQPATMDGFVAAIRMHNRQWSPTSDYVKQLG